LEEPEPAPIVLAEARKPAKRGSGAASAAFDGRWSVVIGTRSVNLEGTELMPTGRGKFFNGDRGYGFIATDAP
jgi:hypothetical protein